jgi:dienelactone hydrolase
VMGHSMGGGGTLIAATADPSYKAAVPLTPWSLSPNNFSGNQVPTMIVACERDTIAPNKTHSDKFYASLSTDLPRGYVQIAGADHLCATSLANAKYRTTLAKTAIAWFKLFVDEDARYTELVQSGLNGAEYLAFKAEGF